MDFSNLFSKVKDLASSENVKATVKKVANSDAVKKAVKKVKNNKTVKSTVAKAKKAATSASKTASKLAKAVGIDMTTLISLASKNKAIVEALAKIGLKKETSEPEAAGVQKLVGSLKTAVSKAVGVKVEDDTFGNIVNKLLSVDTVKSKVEKLAGNGVSSFIKKAVAEYIS